MIQLEVRGSKELQALLKKAGSQARPIFRKAVRNAGARVEAYGKREAPVLTGNLRRLINSKAVDLMALIRSGAEYSIYVHEGTRFQTANDYMQRAADTSKDQINTDFEQAMTDILKIIEK